MACTPERIQEILGLEMQDARGTNDWRRLRDLKDLAQRIARADARGFFRVDGAVLEAVQTDVGYS